MVIRTPATPWRAATLVERWDETPTARTLVLDVPGWPGHRPGQHAAVRLTAADGYRAQRDYSFAAPTDGERVRFTVQRLADGEVSSHLAGMFAPGDRVEVRGPVGGHFVWSPDDPAPVLLVAGGSGIVPLAAMLRERRAPAASQPFRLVYSVRTPAEVYYAAELAAPDPGVTVEVLYTREARPGGGRPRRVRAADLVADGSTAADSPACFVCGPTGFVEAVADLLVDLGHDPAAVRTERFGAQRD